jgi:uncharacterized protein YdaU (DUF1376 family)
MHYYKFNISDWHLATSHLSLEEEAVYFKLINYYYDSEQPIPLETKSVIRRLRLGNYTAMVNCVLEEFFYLKENGWHHVRCDDEIEKYHHKAEINQKVGKLGGRPKKINDLEANPQKTHSVSKNNPQITLTTNQEPLTKNHKPVIAPIGFDLFWDAYDKKVGKPNALKEWSKAKIDENLLKIVVEQAKKCAQSVEKQFRKDPERWIKYKGWEDEIILIAQKASEMPLGTEQQIEEAYRVECGGDPRLARFNSYFEMKKFILDQRDKKRKLA